MLCNFSYAPFLKINIFIFLAVNEKPIRLTVLFIRRVFGQNYLASYWSGQPAYVFHWLDECANSTLS
jgi:hypothetical protein